MAGPFASILACLAGFFLGSLAFGYWWGRFFRGIDVREHGSKNLGATNVFRVLGSVHGIAVLLLDIGKGAATIVLARHLVDSETTVVLAGLCAVLGHILSPWVGFRGGKGVAAGLGAWLLLAPSATGVALLAFALAVGLGRRISIGLSCTPARFPVAPSSSLLHCRPIWRDELMLQPRNRTARCGVPCFNPAEPELDSIRPNSRIRAVLPSPRSVRQRTDFGREASSWRSR